MSAVRPGGRVVVTGASGFVGGHARRMLEAAGYDVVGVSAAEHDLTAGWPDVGEVDGILHLAGLAAVGPSFDEPQRYLEVNSAMVTHLGEWLLTLAHRPRVVVVSTGAVYGASAVPLAEDAPLVVTSPYAVSKVLVEQQCAYYRSRGADVVVARPFNHLGPGQALGFLVPDLAARLRVLPPGGVLEAGDLGSARDYTDVRDVVAAYRLLLELEDPAHDVFNVASGVSRTGHEVLAALCAALGRDVPGVALTTRRDLDPDRITGDASRLRAATGWAPRIGFETSIRDAVAV